MLSNHALPNLLTANDEREQNMLAFRTTSGLVYKNVSVASLDEEWGGGNYLAF